MTGANPPATSQMLIGFSVVSDCGKSTQCCTSSSHLYLSDLPYCVIVLCVLLHDAGRYPRHPVPSSRPAGDPVYPSTDKLRTREMFSIRVSPACESACLSCGPQKLSSLAGQSERNLGNSLIEATLMDSAMSRRKPSIVAPSCL